MSTVVTRLRSGDEIGYPFGQTSLERAAVADAFNFLSQRERDGFYGWLAKDASFVTGACELSGQPVIVLHYIKWALASREHRLDDKARIDIEAALSARASGFRHDFILQGTNLLVFLDGHLDRSTGRIAVLSPKAIAGFLRGWFPTVRITPALQRLLTCSIAGLSLSEISKLDGKSNDTLKTQARELRSRLEMDKTSDLSRILGIRLTAVINGALGQGNLPSNDTFYRYVERYLPASVRSLVLLDHHNQPYRILDMGPKTGKPVIALHAMILPDIRPEDIRQLEHLNLRLLWPLRNGLNAPDDPTLSEAEQIRHACRGIELVREVFCNCKVPILTFAASSKVALSYARANPEHVDALFFAAACILDGRPQHGPRRLAKGMLALATRNQMLMSAAMEYFRRSALVPKRFPEFIRRQFQASRADSRIVAHELAIRFSGERFREALVSSVPSARHDFGFQRALDWETASDLDIEMHFIHGDDDVIHPLPLIRKLVDSLPSARLHIIEDAGQLLYYDHFGQVLAPIAARYKA